MSDTLVRGERPTRAVPRTVRKSPSALWLATGHGERTSVAPRGVATKWSDGDELFRSRLVAFQRSAPVPGLRVAWRREASRPGCTWVSLVVAGRVYRGRRARQQLTVTTGNSDVVRAGWSGKVRGRYKRCEIRPPRGGGHGGLHRAFAEISISRLRPDPWPPPVWSPERGVKSTPRGVTVVEA